MTNFLTDCQIYTHVAKMLHDIDNGETSPAAKIFLVLSLGKLGEDYRENSTLREMIRISLSLDTIKNTFHRHPATKIIYDETMKSLTTPTSTTPTSTTPTSTTPTSTTPTSTTPTSTTPTSTTPTSTTPTSTTPTSTTPTSTTPTSTTPTELCCSLCDEEANRARNFNYRSCNKCTVNANRTSY